MTDRGDNPELFPQAYAGPDTEGGEGDAHGGPRPLADRMRPRTLDEFEGQEHLVGPGKILRRVIELDRVPSLILWGPPGSGKTTLARIVANATKSHFLSFSAVLSGVKEVRAAVEEARRVQRAGRRTLLFVDEIHRFNKAQQDAFLPHVESGLIALIGATTENPSFQVISALLSRCRTLVLHPLDEEALGRLIDRAMSDPERGLGELGLGLEAEARALLMAQADGDARQALGALELAATIQAAEGKKSIDTDAVREAWQRASWLYDQSGEEHYNLISAFIKSLRGSDPDAALYWMARMLEAGEDPLFVARRMVIFASEDVSNAAPDALPLALAAMQAFERIGWPEGWIPLAQAAAFLASCPKSNASYMAYKAAKADVEAHGSLEAPLHLRNAPTGLMERLGYAEGYQYPHDHPEHFVREEYLPEKLSGRVYYRPTGQGFEKRIAERLNRLWGKRRGGGQDESG